MLNKLLRALLPLLLLGGALVVFMLLRTTRPEAAPVETPEKVWQVAVTTVTPGLNAPSLLLYSVVEAPRRATLTAAVAGEVQNVLIAEGLLAKAGQTLVVLDDRDLNLSVQQRQADLAEIDAMIASEQQRHTSDQATLAREQTMLALDEKAVARARDLLSRKVGSESLLDEAQMQLQRQLLAVTTRQQTVNDHPARLAQLQARRARAQALLDQARLELSRTRIEAPFAGRVTQVAVAVGDRVRVGDALVALYAVDDLELRAQVPFRTLPALRRSLARAERLTAQLAVDGVEIAARLDRLSGESAAGGQDALFVIEAAADWLTPGRLLALTLTLPMEADTVALPPTALYGLDRVYRLEDGRMQGLQVERIGERREVDGTVQVLVRSPALKAGDRIVTTQLPNAVSGLKVVAADS